MPTGTLVVVVLKARHLHTATTARWIKQSPYVAVTLQNPDPSTPEAPPPTRTRKDSLARVPPPERSAKLVKMAKTVDDLAGADEHHATPPDLRGGQHPSWDAELRVPLRADAHTLRVECWAQVGLGRRDRPLGDALVEIAPALENGEMDGWIPLTLGGVLRGEVYIEITFFAHEPDVVLAATPRASRLSRLSAAPAAAAAANPTAMHARQISTRSHTVPTHHFPTFASLLKLDLPALSTLFKIDLPALPSLPSSLKFEGPEWAGVRAYGDAARAGVTAVVGWAWRLQRYV